MCYSVYGAVATDCHHRTVLRERSRCGLLRQLWQLVGAGKPQLAGASGKP